MKTKFSEAEVAGQHETIRTERFCYAVRASTPLNAASSRNCAAEYARISSPKARICNEIATGIPSGKRESHNSNACYRYVHRYRFSLVTKLAHNNRHSRCAVAIARSILIRYLPDFVNYLVRAIGIAAMRASQRCCASL